MLLNLAPLGYAFIAALCTVGMLAAFRRFIASHNEDDFLHVHDGDAPLIAKQRSVAHRLEVVDRWGKAMTVLAVILGLLFAVLHAYQAWITT